MECASAVATWCTGGDTNVRFLATFPLLFLFIYAPFIRLLGVTVYLPYFVVVVLSVIGFLSIFKSLRLAKLVMLPLMALLILLGYAFISSFFHGIFDRDFYYSVFSGFFILIAGLGLSSVYDKAYGEGSTSTLTWHLFYSGVFHSIIMMLVFFSDTASSLLYSVIPLTEKGQYFVDMGIRSPGLTSGGGDSLSGLHALCAILGFYMLLRRWKDLKLAGAIGVIFGLYLVLASLALSARTGYVIIFGLTFCLLLALITVSMERFSFRYLTKGFLAFLFFCVFNFFSFGEFLSFLGEERAYKRSAELVINYRESGEASMGSVSALKDMYFLPVSGVDLIWGTGDLGRNVETGFLASDVGYVRAINGYGIVGLILMYVPFVLIGLAILSFHRVGSEAVVLFLCAAAILAMNLKTFYFWGLRDIFKVFSIYLFVGCGVGLSSVLHVIGRLRKTSE